MTAAPHNVCPRVDVGATAPARPSANPHSTGAEVTGQGSTDGEEAPSPWRYDRTVAGSLVVLATLAILYTLYLAKAVLLPATLAVILSLVLRPIVSRMRRSRVPVALSASLLFALVVGVLAVATATLSEPARDWIREAPDTVKLVTSRLRAVSRPLLDLQEVQQEVGEMTKMPNEVKPVSVQIEQPPLTSQVLNTTGGYVTSVTVTLSLLFFLLISGDRFLEKTVEIVPTWKGKRDVVGLLRNIESKISTYLGAITLVNAGLGLVIGLGLWAIGMPNPFLWGVLAALLNYIPFAGLAVGTVVVSFAAIASFDTLGRAVLAPLIYLGANGLEANLITPLLLGRSIDLNPVVILLGVVLGGWVWGIAGIFLAVPLLIIAKIVCETYDPLHPMAVYLAN